MSRANGAIQLIEYSLLLLRSRNFSSSLLIQHPEHDSLWTASQKSAGDSTFYMKEEEEEELQSSQAKSCAGLFLGSRAHIDQSFHLNLSYRENYRRVRTVVPLFKTVLLS
jgi:hypothetical protein